MKAFGGFFLVLVALGLICASMALYTVDQREQVIVLQFGNPQGDVKGPGLHVKIPFIQDVRRFDRRILSVDPQPEQMVISSNRDNPLFMQQQRTTLPAGEEGETAVAPQPAPVVDQRNASGEPIIVDTFARYKIVDPLKFMKTLRTIEAANQRLESIMNDATRTVLGKTTLRTLLSEDRSRIMQEILARVNSKTDKDQLGIQIIDVRIVRADLTPELRQSTVRRMISELKERATETRAKGEERALEITSTAEKQRTVLMAEAQRDAQATRGEGDEEAIKIYADAFSKDKEFYEFNRTMEAYRKTLATSDTRLILSPDSAFFKYFQSGR